MVNAYIEDSYKLVFPLMCNGYLRLNYDDTVSVGSDSSSTEAISRKRNIWAHDDSFTIETIITPYDVNGIGTRTANRHGVLDSTKTPPYPTDAITDRTIYESVDYLGASNYLTQKMMLFYNQYVQLYLENTTSSSYNQPAEYKIVAKLTESGGSTKTVETDTVIKASDKLTGYYDPSGYYDLNSTSYQRVSASASGSNPSGTVTINDYDDVEVNTQATGQIAITADDIANYVSPVAATGSYAINGSNSIPCNTPPVYATAIIKVNYTIAGGTTPGANDYVAVPNPTGTDFKFFQFPYGQGSAGDALDGETYGSNAYKYFSGNALQATAALAATSLASAINAVSGLQATALSASTMVNLTSSATTPTQHNDDALSMGSNATTQSYYAVYGWSSNNNNFSPSLTDGVNEVEDIEFITITDASGTAKKYKASTDSAHTTGQVITDSSSNSCVLYKVGGNSTGTANNLRSAILGSTGHNGTITVASSGATRTLTQGTAGTGGNQTITRTAGITNSHVSIAGFTGGVTEANASNTPHIVLINSAGLSKNYVPVANGDAKANGFSGTIGSVTGVAFQEGANATATAANLETAIEHSNGHAGSITASNSSGTLTLTHVIVGTGGNTTITLTNTTNITKSNLTGGATPDNFVSITDAAGTLKKYKASTVEVTGTTDGTYTFFKAVTDNNTTAANLETAIDGANGHNGTLITTRTNNEVNVKLNQAAMGSAVMSDNVTDITTVNYSSSNNNDISVGSGEAEDIGVGSKIYDSSVSLLGTVSGVSGDTITLATAPASSITSTIYTNQLREALYIEDMFKISLVFLKPGSIEIWMNGELLAKDSHTLNSVTMHLSDCKIGRGATDGSGGNNTQFFGELYEIAMHKGKRPCATNLTLTPGYSDILFYYTFGD